MIILHYENDPKKINVLEGIEIIPTAFLPSSRITNRSTKPLRVRRYQAQTVADDAFIRVKGLQRIIYQFDEEQRKS